VRFALCGQRAAEWHIAADRIGIMGFLGGRTPVGDRVDEFRIAEMRRPSIRSIAVSSRPDFAILGYPVITLTEPWTHQGSKTNLLGETRMPPSCEACRWKRA
jgi:hypothetical protein